MILQANSLEGSFAQIGVGSRALALGGAFTAISDDSSALYWNPAGIIQIQGREGILSYVDLYGIGLEHSFFGVIQALDKISFGVSFSSLHNEIDLEYKESTLGLVCGYDLNKQLNLGFGLRKLELKSTETASGIAIDFGLLYNPIQQISLGLSANNIYSKLRYSTGSVEKLPQYWRGGIALFLNESGTLSFDVNHFGELSFGWEQDLSPFFKLRAGLDRGNLTAGIGIKKGRVAFDYAYLGAIVGNHDSHLLTTMVSF